MKRLCLVLALLAAVALTGIGCESKSHSLFRQQNLKEGFAADEIGIADDTEAVILMEHPSHLTQWYPR
jgi:hypothetical protein